MRLFVLLLSLLAGSAEAQTLVGWPHAKICTVGSHLWAYVKQPDGSIDVWGSSCLPGSCAQADAVRTVVQQIISAASPASAASAAIKSAAQFTCADAAILAEQTPRGDLCREYKALWQAHLPEVAASAPVIAEPSCAPPPPPAVAYVVSTAQAFPLTASGTKSNIPWIVAPTLGEPCDTTVKVVSYGVTFYRVPSLSATQTVVAGCKAKP